MKIGQDFWDTQYLSITLFPKLYLAKRHKWHYSKFPPLLKLFLSFFNSGGRGVTLTPLLPTP